jgi:hypothetical protein
MLAQSVNERFSKSFSTHPKKIDPYKYFDKGTKVISTIIKIYDIANKAILEDSKGWI